MKRIALLAVAVAALATVAACRAKDDPSRQLAGSSGVKTMGLGSYYDGPQDWEKKAAEAYKVPQPTPQPGAPAPAAPAPAK